MSAYPSSVSARGYFRVPFFIAVPRLPHPPTEFKMNDLNVADCIEAIAVCIRMIARTDALIGTIVWSAVKLARGEGHGFESHQSRS